MKPTLAHVITRPHVWKGTQEGGRGCHGPRAPRARGRGRKRTEDGPASANAINFAEKCAGGTDADGECKKVS